MRLFIDGAERDFIPIKTFRQTYDLAPEFGVNRFEPKDYRGLGSIEMAGAQMIDVRSTVLRAAAIPHTLVEWMNYVSPMVALFKQQVEHINGVVHLKDVEIEFAAGGFADVLTAVIYGLFSARAAKQTPPPFAAIYGAWLNSTAKISQTVHEYPYGGNLVWEIKVVTTAYGRFGLIVQGVEGTHYVYDAALGCPAEGYMTTLLSEIAALIYRCA